MLDRLIRKCPQEIDLTNEEQSEMLFDIVQELIITYQDLASLDEAEKYLSGQDMESPVFLLLAFKIARSKMMVDTVAKPLKLSFLFAVYNEHKRILSASEHPHGEDFLRKKYEQLKWLFNGHDNISWEMIIVDDGCPNNSGRIAEKIIEQKRFGEKVKVIYLQHAIDKKLPSAESLDSTSESMKGGSITYGMWEAVQKDASKDHIVLYTDADLSTHLGQSMLLIDKILHQGHYAAIGSRREADSVVIKKAGRNDRGKLFIYLWKRLIPTLGNIIDTQCGFKAFRADIAADIIEGMIEKKFAFDIELLIRTTLTRQGSISKVAIGWIDSEEASTTTDLQPYLPMLRSIVKMYRKYLPSNSESDAFADFIDSLDEVNFEQLLQNIPDEIRQLEANQLNEYKGCPVTVFDQIIA